ncbi:MAG: type II toxin-antitoxin system VapC family toxin [Oscillospiraceae bacterium]|jgi:tRNA(fMet)-specific endonuclease VapC|nr:type II toxin-antitoxin system VapC family toxin [Oscillospiraceae bacterium]
MKYMLDTETCVLIMRQAPLIIEKLRTKPYDSLVVSAITLAELELWVAGSKERARNAKNLLAFTALVEVLPFDVPAAEEYGKIKAELAEKGMSIADHNAMIAAQAKAEGLVIITDELQKFGNIRELKLWFIGEKVRFMS